MNSNRYTDAVGYKFYQDGSFKEFLGATIISFLDTQSTLFAEVISTSRKAQKEVYASKYAFLPPHSYHMTNMVLYNDSPLDRQGVGWSKKIPNNTSFGLMNQKLGDMLAHIEFPSFYRMKLTEVHDNSYRLVPATAESAQSIKTFRDSCAEATGIYFPDHDTYEFHISYAYNIITLDKTEEIALQNFLTEETERIKNIIPEFDIPSPEYCTFRDMSHFEPYKGIAQ